MNKCLFLLLFSLCSFSIVSPSFAKDKVKVRLETSLGNITLELYPKKAPKTVANFTGYVKSKFYDGTVFHRVIDNFMIQGGGLDQKLSRKKTKANIKNEADNGLKNTVGTIAMARLPDPHSASAQFFINVKDNPHLDHRSKTPRGWGYCVFGKVVKGMTVINKMKKVKTGAKMGMVNVPLENIVLKKAVIL